MDSRKCFAVRMLVLLFNATCAVSANAQDLPRFGWTLSASATDPFANTGPATTDTLTVYLWRFTSKDSLEVAGTQFALSSCGSGLEVFDFVPSTGVTENPVALEPCDVNLTFADCPRGSFLAGCFLVRNIDGYFEICLEPTDFGEGVNETYGCYTPTVGERHAFIGYTTHILPAPCTYELGFFPVVSVATSSWGQLKARYRE